jgi:hypothetical protein
MPRGKTAREWKAAALFQSHEPSDLAQDSDSGLAVLSPLSEETITRVFP